MTDEEDLLNGLREESAKPPEGTKIKKIEKPNKKVEPKKITEEIRELKADNPKKKKDHFIVPLVLAVVLILIIIAGVYFYPKEIKQDIQDTVETNKLLEEALSPALKNQIGACCQECMDYGEYEQSKSCTSIISQNKGSKECKDIFARYPKSFGECIEY